MTTYADPTRCPDCRRHLPQSPQTCPSCGLPLTGTTAAQLFATFQRADELLGVLRQSRRPEPVVVGASGGQLLDGAVPYPAAPRSTPRSEPGRVRGASVPQILLTLGALCLLVAAITFLAVAWAWLGVSGRTVVLVGLTGAAFGLSHHFHRRDLRTASEALSVVALGLLALDVVGARHAGWLGAADGGRLVLLTGAVVATGALLLLVSTAARPLVAPALLAPTAVLVAGIGAQVDVDSPAPVLVTALVLLALARIGTLVPSRTLTLTAPALAVIPWCAAVASGFARVGSDPTVARLWWHAAAWPLVVAVLLAASAGLVSGLPALTRPGCAAAALLGGYVVVLGALDNGTTTAVAALLAVTAVWTLAVLLAPDRWQLPAAVAVAGTAVAPVAAALALLGSAAGAVVGVGEPFSQPFDVSVVTTHTDVAPWLLTPLLVVLAAAGCALVALAAPLRRTTWLVALSGAAVVGLIATAALSGAPLAAVVGMEAAVGVAALLGAELLPERTGTWLRGVGLVVLAAATASALPNDLMTALVLAVAGVAAVLLMQRTDVTGDVAGAVLPVALAGLVWSVAEVANVAPVDRAIPIMLLVGGFAIWRPEPPLEASAAVAGAVAAAGSVTSAQDVQLALAVHLTVAGALVTATALVHPSRRFLAWPGGLLLAAATWVRLAQLGVHAPEAYTLPSALVLVALGCWRLRRDDATTLKVLAPGLTLAVVPSLLAALEDPVSLRALVLGLACLCLVLVGVALRWGAPLVIGAGAGALLVLRVLAPYAAVVPTWLVIGVSGVLLTVVGVTWESRLRDVRRASRYVGGLR